MLDAHAHLTDARFASDLAAVLERARVAGVTRVLTCAEDLGSSEAAVALAELHPEVRVAVGVHPHRAATWSEATAVRLLELARQDRVVAVGEAAAAVADDRLLVETDAPYLAPQSQRGRRNEPAYVVETLGAIAGIRGVSAPTLGIAVDANARRLFGDRWRT